LAYCTKTDILMQVPELVVARLTDDSGGSPPIVDDDKVARAIADADALIDYHCKEQYVVPFSDVPEHIRVISVDISIYNLYSRKETLPILRVDRFNKAIKILILLAEGKIRST